MTKDVRMLSTQAEHSAIEALANLVNFTTVCGHQANMTVTTGNNYSIICSDCFEREIPESIFQRRNKIPQIRDECFECQRTKLVRTNIDIGLNFCDECHDGIKSVEHSLEKLYVPRLDAVPDELSPGILYIGQKDCAYNRETLRNLGILRVLICCEFLPAYHYPQDKSLFYHRIPIEDSLVQNLVEFLPSALAFIAQGALKGEKVLVHCNAGVSRSGIIAVEWLRRTAPSLQCDLTTALREARLRRSNIFPNSNFINQIEQLISVGVTQQLPCLRKEQESSFSSDFNHAFAPVKIFVYGTLMKGFGNHHLLEEEGSAYLGRAITCEKYVLHCAGVPFVHPSPSDLSIPTERTTQIHGEVYEVSDRTVLDRLDRLEGHPDFYCRTKIQVSLLPILTSSTTTTTTSTITTTTPEEAYIYFNTYIDSDCIRIESGDFRDRHI